MINLPEASFSVEVLSSRLARVLAVRTANRRFFGAGWLAMGALNLQGVDEFLDHAARSQDAHRHV